MKSEIYKLAPFIEFYLISRVYNVALINSYEFSYLLQAVTYVRTIILKNLLENIFGYATS